MDIAITSRHVLRVNVALGVDQLLAERTLLLGSVLLAKRLVLEKPLILAKDVTAMFTAHMGWGSVLVEEALASLQMHFEVVDLIPLIAEVATLLPSIGVAVEAFGKDC